MVCHHTILFIMRRMKTSNQSKSSLHFAVFHGISFSFVLSWQVPYVWAFIVKFCKEAIKGLGVVDE